MKNNLKVLVLSLLSLSLVACGKEEIENTNSTEPKFVIEKFAEESSEELVEEESFIENVIESEDFIIIQPEDVEPTSEVEVVPVESEEIIIITPTPIIITPTPIVIEPEYDEPTPVIEEPVIIEPVPTVEQTITPTISNETSINITFSSDTTEEYKNQVFSIVNELPSTLKANLKTIDVTSAYGPEYAGLYEVNSKGVMHLSNSLQFEILKATIYHEAAHGFDMSGETLGRFSNSEEFIDIWNKEWANTMLYGSWNSNEAFADAVALYYLGYNGHMFNYSLANFPLTDTYLKGIL